MHPIRRASSCRRGRGCRDRRRPRSNASCTRSGPSCACSRCAERCSWCRSTTSPMVHAAASRAVAETERKRTIAMLTEAGIGPDPAALLEELEVVGLAAVRERGEATTAELRALDPRLGQKMTIARGKPYEATISVGQKVFFHLALDGRIARGRPRGTLDRQPVPLEPDRALAPGRHRRHVGRRRPSRARQEVAAGVRSGHPRRHPVVDGLVTRPRRGKPWPRSTSSRWTSTEVGSATCWPMTSSRARRPSRGSRSFPRWTPRPWAGRIATGTSVGIARRCSTAPATPARRSGSTGTSSVAGRRATAARSRCISSRMSERRP